MMSNQKLGKSLVIVESPNKIKKISSYLGPNYIVLASFGHIRDLAVGDKKVRLGVDISNDYSPKYVIMPDKKDKIKAIIDATQQVDDIYLASDFDREGESIAQHIKECIESCGKPIYRIVFNEITKNAVQKAIANPGQIDEDMFMAQQGRRVLDRLVGFLASEFLRTYFGPNISAGRVQSVATRLIVDRDKEIEDFKPDEYWNINANVAKSANDETFLAKYTGKVSNKDDAKKVKDALDKATFTITKVDAQEKKRNPHPPLITSTLQQAANSRFGFPVTRTMKAAQSLYESGMITYLRTDSTRIAPEAIDSLREFLDKNNYDKPSKPNIYSTKEAAQDAHEAIRPTDVYKQPQNVYLDDDQQKVYRLIWERFVASQMKPALYDTVGVTIKSSSGHELKANGRTLKYEGWLAVASDQKKEDNEEEGKLPILSEKDKLVLINPGVKSEQKFTQPPPRYSEASLVKELEKRGIGRPSTYASIIETIKNRGYVEIKGKAYQSTETGKKVVNAMIGHFQFMEYSYTAQMEEELDKIAEGKTTYVEMLDKFFIPFQQECKKAELVQVDKDYGILCDKCNSTMALRHGVYGFYMKCSSNACKYTVGVDMVDDKPVKREAFKAEKAPDDVLCPKCNSAMHRKDGKYGPYYSCEKYPRCSGSRKIPFGKKCPDCGEELFLTIFNGEMKLACMGYPNCKHVENVPEGAEVNWINPATLVKKAEKSAKTKKYSTIKRKALKKGKK